VEAGGEGQILNAEDQFFILMEAGHLITAIRGMGAPEAGLCYERAESLARSLKCSPSFYRVLLGQWRQSLSIGKLSATLQIAKRLYALAQEQNDSTRLIGACAALACTLHYLGDFEASGQYAIRGFQLWRSPGARSSVVGIVDNAAVSILCYKALFDAHIGKITSSRATMAEAISLAEELKDMYGLAVALSSAASLEIAEHNLAEVERCSSDLIELSTRHHFAHFLAVGSIFRGWARSASGDTAEGIPWIEQGIRDFRATGTVLGLPSHLARKAEALHLADRTSEALEAINEAETVAERFEQRYSLSSLHRLRGVFLTAMGARRLKRRLHFAKPSESQRSRSRFR
jgi:tetratricopeptide (TPR) repeat protein